ncbi:MAG: hypothetical protein O7F71_01055, partial [Gammaproteobacteria bacterium]|nr:hypothetical protein [Gammaproteobacteria bacterium]
MVESSAEYKVLERLKFLTQNVNHLLFLQAKLREKPMSEAEDLKYVGTRPVRPDGVEKVTG